MKLRRLLLLPALLGLYTLPTGTRAHSEPPGIDLGAFLAAVRMVETGDNPRAVGPRGERGSYQFRAQTWRQHTSAPFSAAHTDYAHDVARRHAQWLAEQLGREGRLDEYHLALAWNAGLARTLAGAPPARARDYAQRVRNLTDELRRRYTP